MESFTKKEAKLLTLILLGMTGTGKSTVCEKLSGNKGRFETSAGLRSMTRGIKEKITHWLGKEQNQLLKIVDTQGFFDNRDSFQAIENSMQLAKAVKDGFNQAVYCINLASCVRFDSRDNECLKLLCDLMGSGMFENNFLIVLTHLDSLKDSVRHERTQAFMKEGLQIIKEETNITIKKEQVILFYNDESIQESVNFHTKILDQLVKSVPYECLLACDYAYLKNEGYSDEDIKKMLAHSSNALNAIQNHTANKLEKEVKMNYKAKQEANKAFLNAKENKENKNVLKSLEKLSDLASKRYFDSLDDLENFKKECIKTKKQGAALLTSAAVKIGAKGLRVGAKYVAIQGSKTGAKIFGTSAMKKIPVIGFLVGLGLGAVRIYNGEYGMAVGEIASGAVGCVPGIGTVASAGIDISMAAMDIKKVIQ